MIRTRTGRLRRGAGSSIAVGMLAAWFGLVAADAVADPAALANASADRILASTVIPEPARKVGEVHLLARADAVVVQTLLSTKLLSRVIAEIRKKEEQNWPAGDAAVAAYLAALDSGRETVEKRESAADWSDRRRRLLIEFAADSGDAAVFVGTFRLARDGSDNSPHDREVFATLALPRAYILRNIRLILADSFKLAEQDVDRLGPLGPAAAPAKAGTSAPTAPSAPTGAVPSAPAGPVH